jgi:hypothetical protein
MDDAADVQEAARFLVKGASPPAWLFPFLTKYAAMVRQVREGAATLPMRESISKRLEYVAADARRLLGNLADADVAVQIVNAKPLTDEMAGAMGMHLIPMDDSPKILLRDLLAEVAARALIAKETLRGGGVERAMPMTAGFPRIGRPIPAKQFAALVAIEAWLLIHGRTPPAEVKGLASAPAHDAAAALWRAAGGDDDGKSWRHAFDAALKIPCLDPAGPATGRSDRAAWRRHVREAVRRARLAGEGLDFRPVDCASK